MKKTLIIGGSGFVGSVLIKNLDLNKVINFDKNKSPFFSKITTIGNILDKKNMEHLFKDVDSVVLLAAEHRDDVSPASIYYDVNVQGTKNVLEQMTKHKVNKIVFTSSVAVYGLNKICPDESCKPDPFNDYGKSKLLAEQAIYEWYNDNPDKKSVTIIRPTVIFGERNRGNVYNLFKQIYLKKFLMIGKGYNKKSMCYVENISFFLKNRLESNQLGFNIYNYVDKPDYSMNELFLEIKKALNLEMLEIRVPYFLGLLAGYFFDFVAMILNKKLILSSVRVKKFCATTDFDAKKAHSVFVPPYTIKDGLNRTLNYEFIEKSDDIVFFSE